MPTRVLYGKGSTSMLRDVVVSLGKNCLLVYGCQSAKRNGLYEKVKNALSDIRIHELFGISPNPSIDFVKQGVRICQENRVDFILAVGGGSVIDCAKMISVASCSYDDPWAIIKNRIECNKSIPLITMVTMPGSGSEINAEAVISNYETMEKLTYSCFQMFPKVSIIDPCSMKSIPLELWNIAIIDMFSHALEQYLVASTSKINNSLLESLMKTIVEMSLKLSKTFPNEEVMEELIWCSSLADSLCLSRGNEESAYPIHTIEHELTARYGISHGQGIAMLMPAWLEYVYKVSKSERIISLGTTVFGVSNFDSNLCAMVTIEKMREYIRALNLKSCLDSLNLSESDVEEIAQKSIMAEDLTKAYPPLTKKDVIEVLKLALFD